MLQSHFGGQVLLPENKGLKGMQQVLDGEPGEQPVDPAIGTEGDVIVAPDVDPVTEILNPDVGVHGRGPGDR